MAGVNGYPPYGPEGSDQVVVYHDKAMYPCFLEKTLRINPPAVPKPTQVGGYKDTKARERNLVKELGKIAP